LFTPILLQTRNGVCSKKPDIRSKEPYVRSKEPFVQLKEPHTASSKEPYIPSKEPYIPSKEPYIRFDPFHHTRKGRLRKRASFAFKEFLFI